MTYKTSALTAELMELRDANGVINPREVVKWARRHKRSALYAELDWDDPHAAEEHRIWQVRKLVAIHVTEDDGYRRLVSLSIDRSPNGGYRDMHDVIQRVDLRQIMLEDALTDLRRVQARYQHLQELAAVWTAADEVEGTVRKGGRRRKRAA